MAGGGGGVVPHRARRVKPRRRPRGINVSCCNGLFVKPDVGPKETPLISELNSLALNVYNTIADLKRLKSECEDRLNGPYHPMLFVLRLGVIELKREIDALRDGGYNLRQRIVSENGRPLNEPQQWARDVNW